MDIFEPIKYLSDFVTYDFLHITKGSYLGESINFFIYDIIKIGLLLIIINFIMAITRYYFPTEKIRKILNKKRLFGLDYLLAAILGVVTPFCSCSSIPLFIGFISAGIPLGITFTFLISSPLVNEASLYLFPAIFGIKITLIYNIIGIIIAIIGGLFIQSIKREKWINKDLIKYKNRKVLEEEYQEKIELKFLLKYWWNDGWQITKQIFPYVLIGVGIGALIHGFIPVELVEKYLSSKEWWSTPLAVILGAPLYANSVGVIPIVEALTEKGVPIGTALAFMTAVVTVSFPEIMMLSKVMKWQLLAIFISVTLFGVIIIGYILNIFF
ncbi:MAG: permease [Candidatus Aenigmatarchaeota archaeon]